jgi:cytochrome oxidase assembly protein ShyY1
LTVLFSWIHCAFEYSRSIISNEKYDSGGGLFGNPDAVGYQVVTPFVLEGTDGEAILVNRGWVQKKNINPVSRPQGQVNNIFSQFFFNLSLIFFDPINNPVIDPIFRQVEGPVDLVGVVRKTETRQQFEPKNQGKTAPVWAYR